MPVLNITVKNKIATATKDAYICGNSDYILNFIFDSEWDSFEEKTARIQYEKKYTDIVFRGNQCQMPVLRGVVLIAVGVYAGSLHTTTPAYIAAKRSILCESGISTVEPMLDPDLYNQLIADFNSIYDWAKSPTKPTYTAEEVGALPNTTLYQTPLTPGEGIIIENGVISSTVTGNGGAGYAVIQKPSSLEFPSVGSVGILYADKSMNELYRWDDSQSEYVMVGSDYRDIKEINGGNAHGI